MKRIQIIETGTRFGNMNANKATFLENRNKAANHYGFDPYKMYMPSQTKDGSYVVLTEEMIKLKKDGWDLDIPADILLVTDKTPNVVAGFPVADCAVVIMADLKNGVTATAHCAAEFVDRKLPQMTLDALKQECNSKEENIFVYVSACAGSSWTYDKYPSWATNEKIWEESGALVEKDGLYYIDLRKAIKVQLEIQAFYQFIVNPADTITNDHYYSNNAFYHGHKNKEGRHYAGVFYKK